MTNSDEYKFYGNSNKEFSKKIMDVFNRVLFFELEAEALRFHSEERARQHFGQRLNDLLIQMRRDFGIVRVIDDWDDEIIDVVEEI